MQCTFSIISFSSRLRVMAISWVHICVYNAAKWVKMVTRTTDLLKKYTTWNNGRASSYKAIENDQWAPLSSSYMYSTQRTKMWNCRPSWYTTAFIPIWHYAEDFQLKNGDSLAAKAVHECFQFIRANQRWLLNILYHYSVFHPELNRHWPKCRTKRRKTTYFARNHVPKKKPPSEKNTHP